MLMLAMATVWRRVSAGLFRVPAGRFSGHRRLQRGTGQPGGPRLRQTAQGLREARAGKRFKTIRRARIVTSCRKFDLFGDWYLLLHPLLVRRLLAGKSQPDADRFYYDVDR